MERPTWQVLVLLVVVAGVLGLVSWQVFDRPPGRVLLSVLAGLLVGGVLWWYLTRRERAS